MSIIKQIYINKIKLPKEIKDIIKDFLFHDIIKLTKKRKNKICLKINKSIFTCRTLNKDPEQYSFYLVNYSKLHTFRLCKNCGNYLTAKNYADIVSRIKCKCDE